MNSYVFARMELAEERGLGLKSMKTRAEAAGVPLPRREVIAVALNGEACAFQDFRKEAAEVAIGEEDKRQAARSYTIAPSTASVVRS